MRLFDKLNIFNPYFMRKKSVQIGLFDPRWYLSAYNDVASQGVDPFRHYMNYGWLEGRKSSPNIDEAFLSHVIPDCWGVNCNPVSEILKRIKCGILSEKDVRLSIFNKQPLPKCPYRLLNGLTVAGVFNKSENLSVALYNTLKNVDKLSIPYSIYKLHPLELIDESLQIKCRQVMDRKAAVFVVDELVAAWAVRHVRPGRLNFLIPCGAQPFAEWRRQPTCFDIVLDNINHTNNDSFQSGDSFKILKKILIEKGVI